MTAAKIERVSPATVDQDGEVDWRALLEQAMTMPGRLVHGHSWPTSASTSSMSVG